MNFFRLPDSTGDLSNQQHPCKTEQPPSKPEQHSYKSEQPEDTKQEKKIETICLNKPWNNYEIKAYLIF